MLVRLIRCFVDVTAVCRKVGVPVCCVELLDAEWLICATEDE